MRVHYALLLIAAFFASADAATTFRDSTVNSVDLVRSLAAVSSEFPVKRFLRKHKVTNIDKEERGFYVNNIGFVDDIVRVVGNSWDDVIKNQEIDNMLRQRVSASEAFKIFKVNKAADNLFETAEWKKWATYVALFDPVQADTVMAKALMIQLKPDNMSKMLAAAAKNPNTKAIATKLENAQIQWWVTLKDPPSEFFFALKLDKARKGLFSSPEFETFGKYFKAYTQKNPSQEINLLKMFKESHPETPLTKMFFTGFNIENPAAAKMLDEMLADWLEITKSPYSAFKTMKLDEAGAGLFSNPLFNSWVKYMTQFNEKLPTKKTTIIETLLKSYGDETLTQMINAAKKVPKLEKLATNLETAKTALFSKWMVEGITPDDLFKNVLKLDPATMATNPNTNIWRAYYNAYDKANPGTLFSFNP